MVPGWRYGDSGQLGPCNAPGPLASCRGPYKGDSGKDWRTARPRVQSGPWGAAGDVSRKSERTGQFRPQSNPTTILGDTEEWSSNMSQYCSWPMVAPTRSKRSQNTSSRYGVDGRQRPLRLNVCWNDTDRSEERRVGKEGRRG